MSDILKHLSIIINYFINRTPLFFFFFFLYSNAGHFDPLMYLCMFLVSCIIGLKTFKSFFENND